MMIVTIIYLFIFYLFFIIYYKRRLHTLSFNLAITPISGGWIGDFASQPTNICDFQQRSPIIKFIFLEESSKVLFVHSPIHSYQCIPWNMEPTADEIKIARLEAKVEVVEGKRDQLDVDGPLYAERDLAFTQEITAIRNQIAALSTPRQGKFACLFH